MTETEIQKILALHTEAEKLAVRAGLPVPSFPRSLVQAEATLAETRKAADARTQEEYRELFQTECARVNPRAMTEQHREQIRLRVSTMMEARAATRARAAAIAKPPPKPRRTRAALLAAFNAKLAAKRTKPASAKPIVTAAPSKPASIAAPKPAPAIFVDVMSGHEREASEFSPESREKWAQYFALSTASERRAYWLANKSVLSR